MIGKQKQLLREEMTLLCRKSKEVSFCTAQLLTLPQWQRASSILLYAPLPGEPNLLGLLEKFLKKRFFFPRIEEKKLYLYEWSPGAAWFSGSYGLQEPDPYKWSEVSIEEVDLAVVPGLAFDQAGGRLGRGGGFYDRLLSDPAWRGFKVGTAWSWQMVSSVPREPHDVLMDVVVVS